jgi:hypothetical protein
MAIASSAPRFEEFNVDPALAEEVEAAPEDKIIEGIVRLEDPDQIPPHFTVVSRFQRICTGRFAASDAWTIRRDPKVVSLKVGRRLGIHDREDRADPVLPRDANAPGIPYEPFTKRGCIVAALDFGLDFAHPSFLNPDGTTRLVGFWHQGAPYDAAHPNRFGYGRIYSQNEINAALRASDPYTALGYHPAISDTGHGSHGTLTLDIAAGNGRAPDGTRLNPVAGAASGGALIFVHLSTPRLGVVGDLGDSVRLLEALDYVQMTARGWPWVVNLSVGRTAGCHDGTSLVEQGMHELLRLGPDRAICQSAGNYRSAHLAVDGWLRDGECRDLDWIIAPADPEAAGIDAWYSGKDRFVAGIRPPHGSDFVEVKLGEVADLMHDGDLVGRIYHRENDPNNKDNHIEAFLYPGAPPGIWTLRLSGDYVINGRFHAWIERDLARPGAQSRFDAKITSQSYTLGTIATSPLVITVGAFDAHSDGCPLAPFSSCGPTRDERHDKPELLAPGVEVAGARSIPRGAARQEGLLVARSGTSFAAPHVARAVAAMLDVASRPVSIEEIRDCLQHSAESVADAGHPDCCAWGRLNASEAIRRIRSLTHSDRVSVPQGKPVARDVPTITSELAISNAATADITRASEEQEIEMSLDEGVVMNSDAGEADVIHVDPDSREYESNRVEAAQALEATTSTRPLSVRARILWPALGFPAVISPQSNGSSDPLEATPSRSIVALILSDQRYLGKEDVAHYLRIVPWSQRGRRHIPDGQPGSFGVEDVQVRNDDRGKMLQWPQSDTHSQAVVFGGKRGLNPGQDTDDDTIVVSLSRMVRDFYRKQGLEHLHEIRISEAAAARLTGDQYHLFWNEDVENAAAPSGEMQLLLGEFAKPNRADLAPEWKKHLAFFLDEYKYDYGALHAPYQSSDPQKRLTEVLHPVFIRRKSQSLNIAHMTDTHVDVRPDVYEENLTKESKLAGISFNNYNKDFREIYRESRANADLILLTGDLIDYGRGHVGLSFSGSRKTLGQDGAYQRDRNWMLFYYLLASGGNYTKPVYTCLGNHDWRLNPYPPFAPGAPDPESLVHNADDFRQRPGVLKELIKVAHGPGHEKGFAYTLDAETKLGLLFKEPAAALRALGNVLDTDGSPVQTEVESVAWYLMLINPFLDYSVKLPSGQQLLMLDWAEDEELMNFDEPRSFMEFGQRAANSLTALQKWHVDEFAQQPGKAKIIGLHAPPIGPYFLWEDSDLLKGVKKYTPGENSLMYDANWKRVRVTEHTLFAIRPKDQPRGVEAAYGSFNQARDWFIQRVADPAAGIRLVMSGHIHRNGLLVVRTPRVEPKAWIIRGVNYDRARNAPPPRVGSSEPDANGQAISYFGPLYVNTTSAGPRGHRYQGGHKYVSPGYAVITLAIDGTIVNVSARQIVPAAASPVRTPVAAEESELVSAPRGYAFAPDSNSDAVDRFLDRAERALPSSDGERRESETVFLRRLLGELGCQISAPGLSPAELSRAFLYDRPLKHNAREVLQVLAMPLQRPEGTLRQGDWMLRGVPGTGDVGHVAVLASDDLMLQPMLAGEGVTAESVQPGHYGLVIEAGAYPHSRAQPFARKWLDSRGRVPPHTVLLRPKYSDLETKPDFFEDEDAGRYYAPPVTESGLAEDTAVSVEPFPTTALALSLADNAFLGSNAALNSAMSALAADPDTKAMCVAAVDLRPMVGVDGLYQGFNDDDMLYVGSLQKISPMYAAFELRSRVQQHVTDAIADGLTANAAGWQKIQAALKAAWQPKLNATFPHHLPKGFPNLDTIFTLSAAGEVKFRTSNRTTAQLDDVGSHGSLDGLKFLEWLKLMLRWSHNKAASKCILALSYPYINGTLSGAGFFDPASSSPLGFLGTTPARGLWISGNYRNIAKDWLPDHTADDANAGQPKTARWTTPRRPKTNFGATARKVAALFTLMAKDRLVDAAASQEMRNLLSGAELNRAPGVSGLGSFIEGALHNAGATFDKVSSKIGIGDDSRLHDAGIVERTLGGVTSRYVVVALGSVNDFARLSKVFVKVNTALA